MSLKEFSGSWKGDDFEDVLAQVRGPKNVEPERTPEKEAEVLRRVEEIIASEQEIDPHTAVKHLPSFIKKIRAEVYKPEPREVWIAFDHQDNVQCTMRHDPNGRTNTAGNRYVLFREVIETDS